jgi:UDP-N-acetylglucosamine--dolichyl-phosphate N-acetylglucosaminephosphotransferase
MLAGMNGLEAGMGTIAVGTLGFIAWQSNALAAAVIAACTVMALLAFLLFNWYPARVFPGNVMTYTVGATLAVVAILGNLEKYALILFLPYFAELVLKARGGFQQESFAKPEGTGLRNRTKKWYSLNHAAIDLLRRLHGKATEEHAVLLILGAELILAATAVTAFFL